MTSTTAVVPGVAYHFPKELPESVKSSAVYSGLLEVQSTCSEASHYSGTKASHDCSAKVLSNTSQMVASNLDAALRTSLKPVMRAGVGKLGDSCATDFRRLIAFRESSAPSLDSIIRQRIQTLPKHLILTDSDVHTSTELPNGVTSLCSNTELECLCRAGSQYVPHQPLGLGNAGNTCYLNSVIQCLLATGPLLAYISMKHASPNNCTLFTGQSIARSSETIKNRFCGLCGLFRLLKEHSQRPGLYNGTRPEYSGNGHTVPSYFVCNVRSICPNLRPYQQEDAHEFLLGLLSRMEDSSIAGLGKMSRIVAETNVIRRIFGSIVRSEVTCHSCRKVSARDEPCFNLSVDITCGRSLQQCLFNYIRNEELCDQNAYKCENCRQLRAAARRCTIFKGSPILVIQFNRFSRNQKLDTRVEFPLSFNLRPFMTENKGPPVLYRLYATVNHEGYSCRSGHYVAFTQRNGTWLSHNDSFVSSTSPDHVLRQSPYLLFYESVEPIAKQQQHQQQKQQPVHQTPVSTVVSAASTPKLNCSQPISTIIPLSDIPLPHSSPPLKTVSVSKSPTLSNVSKVSPSNTPRIVFNSAVVRTPPKDPSLTSANCINPSSSAQSTSTCSSAEQTQSFSKPTIRQLLYGTAASPSLWTERPTPTPTTTTTSVSSLDTFVSPHVSINSKISDEGAASPNPLPRKRKRTCSPSDPSSKHSDLGNRTNNRHSRESSSRSTSGRSASTGVYSQDDRIKLSRNVSGTCSDSQYSWVPEPGKREMFHHSGNFRKRKYRDRENQYHSFDPHRRDDDDNGRRRHRRHHKKHHRRRHNTTNYCHPSDTHPMRCDRDKAYNRFHNRFRR